MEPREHRLGLAARKAPGLTKLKDLVRRSRLSTYDDNSSEPDLAFDYGDCDTFAAELAELYAYSELDDFEHNLAAFDAWAKRERFEHWKTLPYEHKCSHLDALLDQLEQTASERRLDAVRIILYLLQGCYYECVTQDELLDCVRSNAYLLYERQVYHALCSVLVFEVEHRREIGTSPDGTTKKPLSLENNRELRLVLAALYVIVETIRRDFDELPGAISVSDTELARMQCLQESFTAELGYPIFGDQPLLLVLFNMVTKFCAGNATHYPMRKVILLLWKTLLAWLGGWDKLRETKDMRRISVGLSPCTEDTLDVARSMLAAAPPVLLVPGESVDGDALSVVRKASRPPLATRQFACNPESDSDAGVAANETTSEQSQEAEDAAKSAVIHNRNPFRADDNVQNDSLRPFVRQSFKLPTPPPKTFPWTPKIREKDIEIFLDNVRMKFFGFPLPSDRCTTSGLPNPIKESIEALRKHIYVSLADVQVAREERLNKFYFSHREATATDSPAAAVEQLYVMLLPQMPQYMIALLKILLAAAPTARPKTDAINILADVLPENIPGGAETGVRLATDMNRHKEIIVKAISAILLLILKHFKVNHVYQFEYISQHLVFANCIPLILKFFDQNILHYVQSQNELVVLNYPESALYFAVHGEFPSVNVDTLEPPPDKQPPLQDKTVSSTSATSDAASSPVSDAVVNKAPGSYFLWRNLFSAINLLRILNKLTKWKHSRTMMLVVFKSAPILKRSLRVKHILLQLYALKLLKMQAKYLGRQWRKTNMEIMSAIYSKVRHRLNDDWAYGNETNAKPWDFQSEECALRVSVELFNRRRYGDEMVTSTTSEAAVAPFAEPEFQPLDCSVVAALGKKLDLTDQFKMNYEKWLQREVFKAKIDWDQLLHINRACLNYELMEDSGNPTTRRTDAV